MSENKEHIYMSHLPGMYKEAFLGGALPVIGNGIKAFGGLFKSPGKLLKTTGEYLINKKFNPATTPVKKPGIKGLTTKIPGVNQIPGFNTFVDKTAPWLIRHGDDMSKTYGKSIGRQIGSVRNMEPGLQRNLKGTAVNLRRHPVYAASAASIPPMLYNSYDFGKENTIDTASQMGEMGAQAAIIKAMQEAGLLQRLGMALMPGQLPQMLGDNGIEDAYALQKALNMQNHRM